MYDATSQRQGDGVSAILDAQFGENVPNVCLGGFFADR
jgi:hypothetical protein